MNRAFENLRCLVISLRDMNLSDSQIEGILKRGKGGNLTQDDILLLQKSQQEEGDDSGKI